MADRLFQVLQFLANFAGRYIKMRMCRVHLSMRTESIKAFLKRRRRCSVNGRKRYENDNCGRKQGIFLKTEQNSAEFRLKTDLIVWTGPQSKY